MPKLGDRKKLQHPKRPVENVALIMKGLQERKTTVNCPNQGTEETSTPYKTCWEYRVNGESPIGNKNTTIEWDDGGKIGNKYK